MLILMVPASGGNQTEASRDNDREDTGHCAAVQSTSEEVISRAHANGIWHFASNITKFLFDQTEQENDDYPKHHLLVGPMNLPYSIRLISRHK